LVACSPRTKEQSCQKEKTYCKGESEEGRKKEVGDTRRQPRKGATTLHHWKVFTKRISESIPRGETLTY